MKIALDYDGTFTRDPKLWILFMGMCKAAGHEVRIVTMRKPEEPVDFCELSECYHPPVIYTSRIQKREYCDEIGWQPDIWIDDSPEFIVRTDFMKFVNAVKGDEEGRGQS